MYKIIAYLYDCMKRGFDPLEHEYSADALGISQRYWADVMKELHKHHFIDGVVIVNGFGNDVQVRLMRPTVTMEGVAFAQENSMMGKAKQFLMDAKASIPFV